MTFCRPQRKISVTRTRASVLVGTLAVLGLLITAAPARAIVLTGGPTYAPGGSWTCTAPVASTEKSAAGGNYTCTGSAGAFTNLYIGVKRDTATSFGDNMDSASAEPTGNERFLWSVDGTNTIRYTGQTSIVNGGTVDTRVTLTFSGTGTMVTDATTQALTGTQIRGNTGTNTAPGVHSLWRVGSAVTSFTVNVKIEASDAGSGAWQPASTYFGTTSSHRPGDGVSEVDRSHVDLAFYTSSCGDSQVDGSEQCDLGGSNGSSTACCQSNCTFRPSGQVCRTSAGVCDVQETCNGSSASCPANGFQPSSTQCRSSAGVCDPAENCTGAAAACPSDARSPSSTTCRASTGVCDPLEHCDGTSVTCPADVISPSSTVCRPVAGVCDVAENCDGSTGACPADDFQPSTVECRGVAGVCDVAENCSGSGANCPADTFQPSSLECRASAGVCDVAESCSGSAADCPADAFQPSSLECRASAGVCDVAENCSGSAADCPADAFQPSTLECRASAGVCDVAESCTGSGAACPTDAFQPSTVECRPDAGQCDVADNCTGSQADCPADAFEPNGTSCDDAAVCTIDDACIAGACVGNSNTCGDGVVQGGCAEECDDGNTDSNDGCSSACLIEIGLACPPSPLSGCKPPWVPHKSQLQLTNKPSPDTKDSVKWKWLRGTRTTLADYGTPLTTTNYQFCLYDQTGLRLEVTDPAGGTCAGKPCWKPSGLSGFKYADKGLDPDGGLKLQLKEGALEKAKIMFSGQGPLLDMPTDLTSLTLPIVVQLHNSDGVCWTTTFSGPPTKQTVDSFKAKAD
jgi:cysteine-rich repeat protein